VSLVLTGPRSCTTPDPGDGESVDLTDVDPGLDVEALLEPYCQWSLESGRKVLVIAEKMSLALVDIKDGDDHPGAPNFAECQQPTKITWPWLYVRS
jgi:hypothetical protein